MSDQRSFDYLRATNFDELKSTPTGMRYNKILLGPNSGATNCEIRYQSTPVGGGSAEGSHVHEWEQTFYITAGELDFEIEGNRLKARQGNLVVIPAGTPHRHWNSGADVSEHLMIVSPVPDPDKPRSRPAN